MKRGTLIGIIIAAIFAGFLLWSTIAAQHVDCQACVEFNGRRNCAKVSGNTQAEALRAAVSTACGPVASGMNESIACQNRPPVSQQCTAR